MADVAPFRGIRYDPSKVGDLATVTAPPYDVIPPDVRELLERASPYNVVRLILGRDEAGTDKYTRAARTLDAWLDRGILVRDATDSLTVYEQRFMLGGQERVQRGVLAAVRLEDGGAVLPHERTMAAPVEDRLRLIRAVRANLSPVMVVYQSSDATVRDVISRVVGTPPGTSFATADDGVAHRSWVIADAASIETVRGALAETTVVIADGHHRYRTALSYQGERHAAGDGPGPWDAMLLYLVDAGWYGPALLPIHRLLDVPPEDVIRATAGAFDAEPAGSLDPEALASSLDDGGDGRAYVLLGRSGAWRLRLADKAAEVAAMPADHSPTWRNLDVAVLEHLVCGRLLGGAKARYVHSATEAAEALVSGEAGSAILLAPPRFADVEIIARAGESMPPKSTFFVPKPRTGVVIRPLEDR